SASHSRGRIYYQINCVVCHGSLGMGDGPVSRYGGFAPAIGKGSRAADSLTDGYIFGMIRNGRGMMPTYNRIEEPNRWDIVNYLRSLQGKFGAAPDSTHGLPGQTGTLVPGASVSAPTRPAPYFHLIYPQAGTQPGVAGTPTALPNAAPAPPAATRDSARGSRAPDSTTQRRRP